MTISKVATVVSTKWLREQLGSRASNTVSRELRVLDTSFQKDKGIDTYSDYSREHIPGSLHFCLHHCVESRPEVPRNLPNHNCFTKYIQGLGVWPDTHVIAYDRFGPSSAYRTWWTFRMFGHTNVSVLDGGFQKWLADGYEVTTVEPKVQESDYVPMVNSSLLRHYEDLVDNIKSGREQLIDARAHDANTVIDPESDSGIIPGSKHISFDDLFHEDGTMKSDTELKSMFDAVGIDLNKPMIATCFTGMTACAVAAAAHVLGKDVPVYYGSWTEWRHRAPKQLKHRRSGGN